MDAEGLREYLAEALERKNGVARTQDFEDAGIYSSAEGLVVEWEDGSQHQITVVTTRYAPLSRPADPLKGRSKASGERGGIAPISQYAPPRNCGCGECWISEDR